jgi:uncharacterized protein YbaR (Trm112 family)
VKRSAATIAESIPRPEREDTSMPVSPELLEILVCPETKQPVAEAPADLIARLNEQVRDKSLRNRAGEAVSDELEEGLLREDGKILYPVDDGIPVMLIEESIEIG